MYLSLENNKFISGEEIEKRRNSLFKPRLSFILSNDLKENNIDELFINNEIKDEYEEDFSPSPQYNKWNSSLNEILEETNNLYKVENNKMKDFTPLNIFNLKKSELNTEIYESDEEEKK